MDTLILFQADRAIEEQFKKRGIKIPPGIVPGLDRLTEAPPSAAQAALGVIGDKLAAAKASRRFISRTVTNSIIKFAEVNIDHENSKPPAQQKDVAEFQIVVMFHQSASVFAEGISDGLMHVFVDKRWLPMPIQKNRAHRVARVWLLSCESAADVTALGRPEIFKYRNQALVMRRAASAGVMTFKEPPQRPGAPETWFPDVYTFSTGDPVTGAITMHPTQVEFKTIPNWEVKNGVIQMKAGAPQPDVENPSAGTVYKYSDNKDVPQEKQIGAGQPWDILTELPPF